MFSCDFCEISKNTFSYRTLPVDTSEIRISLSIQVSSDIFCQYFFVCSELYSPEAALKRCSKEMVLCKATLLKSHFSMAVLLKICCIFSHLFLGIPLEGCFWFSFFVITMIAYFPKGKLVYDYIIIPIMFEKYFNEKCPFYIIHYKQKLS